MKINIPGLLILMFRDFSPFVLRLKSGLIGVVVSIADCYPKGAGFDSRVMLGIFPLRKSGLRTLV
jgi:hypothetical protein